MVTWSALEWRDRVERPRDRLAHRFGARRPHGYLVRSRIRRPGEARYRVLVEYRGVRPRLARDTLALRVLRPSGERLRTEPGLRWGVDPASVTVVAPPSER